MGCSVKPMTLTEIKRYYPNEWVLIEFTELDDDLQVVEGQVIALQEEKERWSWNGQRKTNGDLLLK